MAESRRPHQTGTSLVELLIVIAVILLATAVTAAPAIRAYLAEAHLLGAGRVFLGEFRKARSIAVRTGAYTAIRFERSAEGPVFSVYVDGNRNGVLADDIARQVDKRIAGPLPLNGGAPDVQIAIMGGVPAIPPDTGIMQATDDPIRFGRSDLVSFSPLGTASPGTFYLAGQGMQAAVRVTPGSARVRMLFWRGGRWRER
jgi:hypothetical protein